MPPTRSPGLAPRHFPAPASLLALVFFALPARPGAGEEVLIGIGEDWDYFKGTGAPPAEWKELDFDPAGWLSGPTGIGYGDGDDATVLGDMQNRYASVYCRRLFAARDPRAYARIALRIDYDDGFVAYLNGEEVARSSNMGQPGTPVGHTTLASGDHEANGAEAFVLDIALLLAGDNVLAVEVHNATLGSSDLSFIPELVADPELCPSGLGCSYDAASRSVRLSWTNQVPYDSIEVRRNGEVLESLDGRLEEAADPAPPLGEVAYEVVATDFGTECPALTCTVTVFAPEDVLIDAGDLWRFLRGNGAVPPGWFEEDFDDSSWEVGLTGIGYGDGDDATVLGDMRDSYVAVFCRKELDLPDLEGVERLVLSVVYDDGIVVYLGGEEIARRNVPAGPADEFTTAGAAIEPRQEEIPIPLEAVSPGRNVLAASVHNASFTSSDLSFIPILAMVHSPDAGLRFRRGDASNDGGVNLTDAVSILNHLFRGRPITACLDAGDIDDNGILGLTDAVALLNSLFRGGPAPPLPGRESCGPDPTPDPLGDCATAGC